MQSGVGVEGGDHTFYTFIFHLHSPSLLVLAALASRLGAVDTDFRGFCALALSGFCDNSKSSDTKEI